MHLSEINGLFFQIQSIDLTEVYFNQLIMKNNQLFFTQYKRFS